MQVAQYNRALLDNGLPLRKRDGSKKEKAKGMEWLEHEEGRAYDVDEKWGRGEEGSLVQGL